jgi:hypothetical protein
MVLMVAPPYGRTLYNVSSRGIQRSLAATEDDRQTPAPGSRPRGKSRRNGAQTDVEDSDIESTLHPAKIKPARSVTSTHLSTMRASFARLAAQRRETRTRILGAADGHVFGEEMSPVAMRATLGAMLSMFEKQEERWRKEIRRLEQERVSAEGILRQVVGSGV